MRVLAEDVEVVERVDCVAIGVTKTMSSSVRLRSTTAQDLGARYEWLSVGCFRVCDWHVGWQFRAPGVGRWITRYEPRAYWSAVALSRSCAMVSRRLLRAGHPKRSKYSHRSLPLVLTHVTRFVKFTHARTGSLQYCWHFTMDTQKCLNPATHANDVQSQSTSVQASPAAKATSTAAAWTW